MFSKQSRQVFNPDNPRDLERMLDYMDQLSDIEDYDDGELDDEDAPVGDSEIERLLAVNARNSELECSDHEECDDILESMAEKTDNQQEVQTAGVVGRYRNYIPRIVTEVSWRDGSLVEPIFLWTDPPSKTGLTPMEPTPNTYFSKYIPWSFFELMMTCTNMYALQSNARKFKLCTTDEMSTLVGLHLLVGVMNYPRIRLYWDSLFTSDIFRNAMFLHRFFQLRTNLHIVDTLSRPEGCTDRLWKVRPIFDSIRKRCLELELERELSIDEQIIPFKGQLSIKQYMKKKPYKWGIKIFALTGKSGCMHDFFIYQGSTTPLDSELKKKLGFGGAVVATLVERVNKTGHKLFFDNYFTSYNLMIYLRDLEILAAGTIRLNRFGKVPLLREKEFKKKERGFTEEYVSNDAINVLRWKDNRPVCLSSNFIGAGEKRNVKRWNKKLESIFSSTAHKLSVNITMGWEEWTSLTC